MNNKQLTKLANALVKKREKRAALWDKLLRTGKLSEHALARIIGSGGFGLKFDRLLKLFPTRSTHLVPGLPPMAHSTARNLLQDVELFKLRKAQVPAKPYAPMEGILKQLAETRKAKGKMAPSSQLDKGLFKGLGGPGEYQQGLIREGHRWGRGPGSRRDRTSW